MKWPWTKTAPTAFMQEVGWAPIDNVTNFAVRTRPQPDLIGWVQPTSLYRSYPGAQLHGGVAQLSSSYVTPTANATPYWQQQTRTNPPQAIRFGGSAAAPMGPVQALQLARKLNGPKPMAGTGVGTIYPPRFQGS